MAFIETQKAEYLKDLDGLARKIEIIRAEAKKLNDEWFGKKLQAAAANELTQEDIDATAYAGVPLQAIYDTIGSLAALETFCQTHDENYMAVMA